MLQYTHHFSTHFQCISFISVAFLILDHKNNNYTTKTRQSEWITELLYENTVHSYYSCLKFGNSFSFNTLQNYREQVTAWAV